MACRFSWCGLCYENLRGRSNHKGHRGYRAERKREKIVALDASKRRVRPGPGAPSDVGLDRDDVIGNSREILFDFLVERVWSDGRPRQTASLLIFVDEGQWKACLNDRDSGSVAFVSSSSVGGLLDAISDGLRGDSLDWRRGRDQGKRRK